MKPLVIALGGNALIQEKEVGNYEQQLKNVQRAVEDIIPLIRKGQPVVIVHGNGPQVGSLEVQMHAVKDIPPMPLNVEVAMTQGEIGHLIIHALTQKKGVRAATLITHVEVNARDAGFRHPSKPIGKWMNEKEMKKEKKKGHAFMHDPKKGFRRIVASPQPQKIVEIETIRALLREKIVVVACGGGGIPVVKEKKGWKGVEAVIDKDLAAQHLANELGAETLVILTNEDAAYTGFGTPHPVALRSLTPAHARKLLEKGEFGKGSMEPKIEACIRFIQKGGKRAYIGKTGKLTEVMNHEDGTCLAR